MIVELNNQQIFFEDLLTLSQGGFWADDSAGKNACAKCSGHISVISGRIRVVSKAEVKST